jgi:hypothetical protein
VKRKLAAPPSKCQKVPISSPRARIDSKVHRSTTPGPFRCGYLDAEEGRDATHLARQVGLEIVVVQQEQIGEGAALPEGGDVKCCPPSSQVRKNPCTSPSHGGMGGTPSAWARALSPASTSSLKRSRWLHIDMNASRPSRATKM